MTRTKQFFTICLTLHEIDWQSNSITFELISPGLILPENFFDILLDGSNIFQELPQGKKFLREFNFVVTLLSDIFAGRNFHGWKKPRNFCNFAVD